MAYQIAQIFIIVSSIFTVSYILKARSFHKLLTEYEGKEVTMGKVESESTSDML